MKDRFILFYAICLSIVIEFILIYFVYQVAGTKRLPVQLFRITIQFILIFLIYYRKSNIALLALAGYHVFSGLTNLAVINSGLLAQILFVYHFVIGIIMYFHDSLENIFARKKN